MICHGAGNVGHPSATADRSRTFWRVYSKGIETCPTKSYCDQATRGTHGGCGAGNVFQRRSKTDLQIPKSLPHSSRSRLRSEPIGFLWEIFKGWQWRWRSFKRPQESSKNSQSVETTKRKLHRRCDWVWGRKFPSWPQDLDEPKVRFSFLFLYSVYFSFRSQGGSGGLCYLTRQRRDSEEGNKVDDRMKDSAAVPYFNEVTRSSNFRPRES